MLFSIQLTLVQHYLNVARVTNEIVVNDFVVFDVRFFLKYDNLRLQSGFRPTETEPLPSG